MKKKKQINLKFATKLYILKLSNIYIIKKNNLNEFEE